VVVPVIVPIAMRTVTQPPAWPIVIDIHEVIVASRSVDDGVPAANDRTVARAGAISAADDRSVACPRAVADTRTIADTWPIAGSRPITRNPRSIATWRRERRGAIRDIGR